MNDVIPWAAVAVAAVVVVVIIWRQQRAKYTRQAVPMPAGPSPAPADPLAQDAPSGGDPLAIQIGDEIDLGFGDKVLVRGTASFTEDGYRWKEHFLHSNTDPQQWLSVEDDAGVKVVLWTALAPGTLSPGRQRIEFNGDTYNKYEEGDARYTTAGTTDLPKSGKVNYTDYRAPGGKRLSFERFDGGKTEGSFGEVIPPGTYTIYPGS